MSTLLEDDKQNTKIKCRQNYKRGNILKIKGNRNNRRNKDTCCKTLIKKRNESKKGTVS